MIPKISKITELMRNTSNAFILKNNEELNTAGLSDKEINYVLRKLEKNSDCRVNKYPYLLFFFKNKPEKERYRELENARKAGSKLFDFLKDEEIETVQISGITDSQLTAAFIEGLLLSCYKFDKYKKEKETFSLKSILVLSGIPDPELNEMVNIVQAVFYARNLINEPLSHLNAIRLSEELEKLGEEAGFSVEVFHKQKIEALKMGGLLAVNKGSIDPPTFSVLEWNPENALNKKPVVLIGKGIVFDTGGLSLKPTPKSMDYMKCDMAGAAVVAATIYAASMCKLPLRIVGLIPATDNRPDGNAYVPGDVITMFDGTTVEIKNTDAEGRLILADALSYAKKYKPELVVDIATLTGAAEIVAGKFASVIMGNSPENIGKLKISGEETFEQLIELPLWDEYAQPLKSAIADLNNLGTKEAQATIAGKFLEHFTSYNWIHIDIASTAFIDEKNFYRPVGGTGTGVRLLFYFLKKLN